MESKAGATMFRSHGRQAEEGENHGIHSERGRESLCQITRLPGRTEVKGGKSKL